MTTRDDDEKPEPASSEATSSADAPPKPKKSKKKPTDGASEAKSVSAVEGKASKSSTSDKSKAAPKVPKPPIFERWMISVLAIGVLIGGAAGFLYYKHYDEWLRPGPKVKLCAVGVKSRLAKGELFTGDQEVIGLNDEKVYLTDNERRAVQCTGDFAPDAGKRLASAFNEREETARATGLAALVTSIPKAERKRDDEASNLYHLIHGALEGMPKSEHRDKVIDELEESHACRYLRPRPCAARPAPTVPYALGAISGVSILVVLGGLARGLLRRRSANAS